MNAFYFPNMGCVMTQLPPPIFNSLQKRIEEIQADFSKAEPYNKKLAGHLERQFDLADQIPVIQEYIMGCIRDYDMTFGYHTEDLGFDRSALCSEGDLEIYLKSLWVNFQQKHEFNPTHQHAGTHSFVIWMQIPYDIREEMKMFDPVNRRTSCFEFTFQNILGRITHHPIYLDKSHEGKMLIFPSKLNHAVHPFYTSDGYRISISGNIHLREKTK